MKGRLLGLFCIVFFLWFLLIGRAGVLQVFPDARLENLKSKQFSRTITLRSKRGGIYDRLGKPLAFFGDIVFSLFRSQID